MVVVAVIAMNLGAARILYFYNTEILIGVALSGLALQAGLFQLVLGRGRNRAFWSGLVVFGLLAMSSLVWAMLFPEVIGIAFDKNGVIMVHRTPGSFLSTVWSSYAGFVSNHVIEPVLESRGFPLRINPDSYSGGALLVSVRAVVRFLPQMLIAVIGGLLARSIVRREATMRRQEPAACS